MSWRRVPVLRPEFRSLIGTLQTGDVGDHGGSATGISIPHRYPTNTAVARWRPWTRRKFRSLIGTLQTYHLVRRPHRDAEISIPHRYPTNSPIERPPGEPRPFRSLIGTLQTWLMHDSTALAIRFRSLIGTLQTLAFAPVLPRLFEISIPHRYR